MPGMAMCRLVSQTPNIAGIPNQAALTLPKEVPGYGLSEEMPLRKEPRQTASEEDAAFRAGALRYIVSAR